MFAKHKIPEDSTGGVKELRSAGSMRHLEQAEKLRKLSKTDRLVLYIFKSCRHIHALPSYK